MRPGIASEASLPAGARARARDRVARWLVPSVADMLFVLLAFAIATGFSHRLLNSDGDMLRHIRLGAYMLDHGALVHADRFSHTAAGRPFTAYEWLSELVFAAVYQAGGFPGVVVFSSLLLALVCALALRFMQRRGTDTLLAYLMAMLVAVFTSPHWVARPHIFTFLGTILLLFLLVPEDGRLRPWLFAPLFIVWANLHPGFTFGIGLIGVFLAADVLEWLGERSTGRARRVRLRALALAAALLGSLVNPSGIGLLRHVHELMGTRYLLDVTEEFRSPDFHSLLGKMLLMGILGSYTALVWRRERPRTATLLALLALTSLALQARRNIALFGLVSFPLLALELDQGWRRVTHRRLGNARRTIDMQDRLAGRWGWAAAAAGLLILLAAARGRVGSIRLLPDDLDPRVFPVEAVERARAAGLKGRIFNDFIWGGYLLFAWPEQKVFIDGATDFYGEELTRTYVRISTLEPGWREALDRWRIGIVLLPREDQLAAELRRSPGWKLWHEDATAVVYVRAQPISRTAYSDQEHAR